MPKKRKSRTPQPEQPEPQLPEPVTEPKPESEPNPEPEIEQPGLASVPSMEEEHSEIEHKVAEEGNEAEAEAEADVDIQCVGENEENDDVEDEVDEDVGAEVEVNEDEDEDEDEDEEDPIEKILEPFTKEQLCSLLKEAVTKFPSFNESIRRVADLDPVHRKIFVHGLGWDTTAETLISVFGEYGEVEDCKAVTDKATGKSKGYAFILFKRRSGARKALKEPQKKIGSRVASCQLASAGPVNSAPPQPSMVPPVSEHTQRKIFVTNVGAEMDIQKLVEFFSRFGEIEEGPLGLDKHTGKAKGFCLFVYKSLEGARRALEEPHKNYEGHILHCQKAVDGPKMNKGGGVSGGYQPQQHHHSHQPYYGHTAKRGKYSGGSSSGGFGAAGGHMMAPGVGPNAVGYNPAASGAFNPALGQALALLASQGNGLGLGNILGGMGAPADQGVGVQPSGYGGQGGGVYGQPGVQGGYANPQMPQGGVRPYQGGAPYMGGHGR